MIFGPTMRANGNASAPATSLLLVTHSRATHSRALELLARSPTGRTETFMLIHGCTPQYLDGLVRAGLVTTTKQRVGRGRQIEITRFKLTEAGRATLSEGNATVVPQRIQDVGKPASAAQRIRAGSKPPNTNPKLRQFRTKQVDDRARVNDAENRPALVTEILSLSRPPPGRERRARLVLSKFTLNELRVLARRLGAASPTT